jgi:FMN-dependent NADH-azoreductase
MTRPTTLLIDSSARLGLSGRDPHGSHTRRLSQRFIKRWQALRPADQVRHRDVALQAPSHVTEDWVAAAFTPPAARTPAMHERLAESDALVDELIAADLIVVGVPMYNFGMPSTLKAYIDNIVRVGRTFGFDRQRTGEPYWPMLKASGKRLVLLSSRGDHGYGQGERLAQVNHVEPAVRAAFAYIGVEQVHSVAVEFDEFGDERLTASLAAAERQIDALAKTLAEEGAQPA